MWVARDKNGILHLFDRKPELHPKFGYWYVFSTDIDGGIIGDDYNLRTSVELNSTLYPEVTFENSPKELIVK